MSAVVGPAIGGLLSQYGSWRWIFLVNLPVGAVAVWLLARSLHERVERHERSMDVAGAIALVTGWSLVLLGLLEGGVAWAWNSGIGVGVLIAGVLALVAFAVVERRAVEPRPADQPIGEPRVLTIPLRAERVTLERVPFVREEVTVARREVEDTQAVVETVRHEEAVVETRGEVAQAKE
jgi:MFS family permease